MLKLCYVAVSPSYGIGGLGELLPLFTRLLLLPPQSFNKLIQ